MVAKANRENWRRIHLVFFPRGPKTNQRSQDRSLAQEEGLGRGGAFHCSGLPQSDAVSEKCSSGLGCFK